MPCLSDLVTCNFSSDLARKGNTARTLSGRYKQARNSSVLSTYEVVDGALWQKAEPRQAIFSTLGRPLSKVASLSPQYKRRSHSQPHLTLLDPRHLSNSKKLLYNQLHQCTTYSNRYGSFCCGCPYLSAGHCRCQARSKASVLDVRRRGQSRGYGVPAIQPQPWSQPTVWYARPTRPSTWYQTNSNTVDRHPDLLLLSGTPQAYLRSHGRRLPQLGASRLHRGHLGPHLGAGP
jgi:hypothetical protein